MKPMNIYEYLCKEAKCITANSLSDIGDRSYWDRTEAERRRQFISMLGLTDHLDKVRKPTKPVVTGVLNRRGYAIEKLHFQSLPGLYVTGNLYVPESAGKPAPGVLYLCGHSLDMKHHYQAHARKFAQLGFVTLIIETIERGEVRGHHHGPFHYGWFNWYSWGYTPAGVEVWNAMNAIDLLQSRPEVNPESIGVTGISGGGAISWFTAAVDNRVKIAAPVCGTATIESHVCKHTTEEHCDCMFWINNCMWDLSDVGALIAPRPLLICSAQRDWMFDIESVRMTYRKIKKLYETLGLPDNVLLVETPGGHSYHESSRVMIFKWFLKHLRGIDASPEEIGAIDESPSDQEPLDALRVFDKGPPLDEKVTTVQESFIKRPEAPIINGADELSKYRHRLNETLLRETFGGFPRVKCDLDIDVELTQEDGELLGYMIGFTPEEGLRLHVHVTRPSKASGSVPILIAPAKSARAISFGDDLMQGLDSSWARAFVEVRGIGETSWAQDFQWFIRRASMLTGRTIASMRVYDLLRAIEALSSIDWIDRRRMVLMGSGDMAAVVLYAALLNGKMSTIVLHDPPATQNARSNQDGTGPALEMLNCLRHTDFPYVAGLLWPAELIFLGPRPEAYSWTNALYAKLGPPGKLRYIKSISELS